MKKRRPLAILALSLLIICVLVLSMQATFLPSGNRLRAAVSGDSTLSVHYIDVGQADATLLLCDGASMLIDGGNVADSSLVAAYLKEQKITQLDYIVATHAHEDHVGGLSGALNVAKASTVYSPVTSYDSKAFRDFSKYVSAQDKSLTVPKAGDHFSLGSATVEIIGPQKVYEEPNNTSIVLRVTHGKNSFLFTGDAERQAERDMLDANSDLSATVLKLSHHGSETSTSYPFLRAVAPRYAVIPVGTDNSYGHPHEAVLSRLRDADVAVYRTDMQGHIVVESKQDTLSFQTKKNATTPTNPTVSEGTDEGDAAQAYYIGNKNSKRLHAPDCVSPPAAHNQMYFPSIQEALEQGYLICSLCLK